jgi:hypothetical protein
VHGELKKLAVTIGKTTVRNVLRHDGIPPRKERKSHSLAKSLPAAEGEMQGRNGNRGAINAFVIMINNRLINYIVTIVTIGN